MRPQLQTACQKVQPLLQEWLDAESINYLSVSARAKSVESFAHKCSRVGASGSPKYPDPLNEITDLVGIRVITYIPDTVERVCALVRDEFDVVEETDKGRELRARGLFGYASNHFLVRLSEDRRALPEYRRIGDRIMEIQIRTAVQHAWAEFEHDVRYKVTIPASAKPEFDRRFLLAAALLEMADSEFTQIDRMYRGLDQPESPADSPDPEPTDAIDGVVSDATSAPAPNAALDGPGLRAYLSRRYPEAPKSKADHYEWLVSVLTSLAITTTGDLEALLRDVPSERVAEAMGHLLPAGQIRRIDDDLLAALGDSYAEASERGSTNASSRRELLRPRRDRLLRAGFPVV